MFKWTNGSSVAASQTLVLEIYSTREIWPTRITCYRTCTLVIVTLFTLQHTYARTDMSVLADGCGKPTLSLSDPGLGADGPCHHTANIGTSTIFVHTRNVMFSELEEVLLENVTPKHLTPISKSEL